MRNKIGALVLAGGFLMVACSPAAPAPTATSYITPVPVTATQEQTLTSAPTESHAPSFLVIYDFQELHCQATWTNNGQNLTCPANMYEDNPKGMVSLANESSMEGMQLIADSALMTLPSQNGSFYGIFGAYPPISIQGGDEFRARIGCMDIVVEAETCNVQFALEYYDSNGNYIDGQETGWFWNEINDGATRDIVVDLSRLAGETVRLTLVVRDNGDPTGDYALWLHPQLWRSQFNP